MPTYHTYTPEKGGWNLPAGYTLGFSAGNGYYAIPPAPAGSSMTAAEKARLAPMQQTSGAGMTAAEKARLDPMYTGVSGGPSDPTPTGPSSGGGGGGGGSSKPSSPEVSVDEPTDWASYLGLFGLNDEAMAAINAVKRTGNIQIDSANILNALRQTQWYRDTYPGIAEAIARGIVSNEADYRQKKNEFDQVYQQNYGRAITNQEYADFLKQGYSADIVNRQIQGDKYINANRNDIQYAAGNFGDTGQYSNDQLKEVGRNKAGLGTQNGVNLQAQLDKAIARAQRVFQGTLAGMQIQNTNQTGAPAPSNQYPDIER